MTKRSRSLYLRFGIMSLMIVVGATSSAAADDAEAPFLRVNGEESQQAFGLTPATLPWTYAPWDEGGHSLLGSASASGQERQPGTPREILPDLGQIGAQVSLLLGYTGNPYEADDGFVGGASIDLPLFKLGKGKVSYEIMISNQTATTDVRITSALSAIGDLLAADGLGDTLTSQVLASLANMPAEEDMDVLAVLPFGLKYTFMNFDHARVRPYIVGAVGVYVTITDQNPLLTLDPRLAGAFIGGIVPQALELSARGVPEGQGDIRFGGNVGGGFEYRVMERSSLGLEYRYNKMQGRNGGFSAVFAKLGLHF